MRINFSRIARFCVAFLLCWAACGAVGPASARPEVPLSSAAERIYSDARPRLLQIRTLVTAAGRQSSVGSGFLVRAGGYAITNYHVVSQYALEPESYHMEYSAADGSKGPLTLIAVDVANDLALVKLDHAGFPFFNFDPAAVDGKLLKGERVYSMGNPLDIGFTIVEGTYNGLVERAYNDRIHFSGALNPGMSGGPAVNAGGRIVGINVAKSLRGDLVSFLVPARFAAQLLARALRLTTSLPRTFTPRLRANSSPGKAVSTEASAPRVFTPPRSDLIRRLKATRPGSIAGRKPMPVIFPSRARRSTPPAAVRNPIFS